MFEPAREVLSHNGVISVRPLSNERRPPGSGSPLAPAPERTAVIVVDVQRYFTEATPFAAMRQIVPRIARFLPFARVAGMTVGHLKSEFRADREDAGRPGSRTRQMMNGLGGNGATENPLIHGRPTADIVPEFTPQSSDVVVTKTLHPAGALHRIGTLKNYIRQKFQIANAQWRVRGIIVGIVLALCSAPAVAQQLAGARQVFDGKMLPDVEVATFEHSDTLFSINAVPRKGPVRPLPPASTKLKEIHFKSEGKDYDLFDYLAYNRVAGLLILKDGEVALEDYELGAGPQTRWPSFSIAKSFSSTLVGAALKQGLISSLDDPLARYVPLLKGGAYEGVSIRNVLQMASGVRWDETYTDPKSDRRKLLELQLAQKPGAILSYMNALSRTGAPGSMWNYSTGESFLVGALIEGATHKPLATYLSETIWSRLGMEQDATWWVESPGGMGLAGSGLGATLRDYGRFGLFVQQDGVLDGQRVVPEGWFREAGASHVIGGKSIDYGYLWWPIPAGDPIHQGAFQGVGIFGQHLYINPNEKLVIVVLSARPKPDSSAHSLNDASFFAAVARSLD